MSESPPNRHVVGVMTGTSIDGMDAALLQLCGIGLSMQAVLVAFRSEPLGDLQGDLRRAAGQVPMSAGAFATLAWRFGELHASVVTRLIEGQPRPDLIVAHGQTVFHRPPVSWQLLNPAPIEALLNYRVMCDLRQPDLAAGGEGAPITPLADWIMFRSTSSSRAVVNLGGFANATILPRDDGAATTADIQAFDIGACNHVLNAVAVRCFGEPFDRDGAHAAKGQPDNDAADALLEAQREIAAGRRSLGTGDELSEWVEEYVKQLPPCDLAATAVRGVARHITSSLSQSGCAIDEILLAGGGALNHTLVEAIAEDSRATVRSTAEFGIPAQQREAAAMAILGALRDDGIAITLPQVTGCCVPAPVAGVG